MAPRRHHANASPLTHLPARVSLPPARSTRPYHCTARRLLILLSLFSVSITLVCAEQNRSVQPADTVRVLSGSSFRAFSNRFRRHLRVPKGDCLSFHAGGDWWRYEWCVGRHIRQFHNATLAAEWSIVLGRFDPSGSKTIRIQKAPSDDADAQRDPETRGFVATQHYAHGDSCGDFRLNRTTEITYKCCVLRANETYLEAVDEPSPCHYALSVCTPVACGLLRKDQYAFGASPHVSDDERRALLATVKDMFYHAYHGYMDYAFPLDALLPLSCRGETFELGKIPMLTLIDTLDTLAILEDRVEFQRAVKLVIARADFDLDTEVSVFETTIRVLGGLLSAHLFAVEPTLQLFPPAEYQNELLALAVALADRLLPAFNTTTGIPYGTVNLRSGVPRGETPIASTAGAGSLTMEFTMLSVLTGNPVYATASRQAVRALYERRSRVGLLGKHIDTATGEWTETASGVGSNSDSFYEYLWKMYATFNDREMLEMFETVYPAVQACNRHGDWFTDVSMWTGCGHHGHGVVFENLVAFWPGMQASLGHVDAAAQSLNAFYRVWRDYGFIPEQFNVLTWKPVSGGGGARYPLRPELIESTFYLHEATNDSSWLRAGAHFVHSLQKHTKTKCGYATVRDVETKQLDDNMPSFFLSETCKYLILLFNTTHFVRNGSYIFTTEAHPFPILPTSRVERVVLPTLNGTALESDSSSSSTTTTSASRGRVCRRPVFWQLQGYAVDYEGTVTERTERCARPKSSTTPPPPSVSETTIEPKPKRMDDWLPLLDKLAKLASTTETTSDNEDGDGAFLQRALRVDADGTIDISGLAKSVPTDELMAQLNEKIRQSRHHEEYENDSPRFQYVNGGPQLGLFRMDQTTALSRFTRQDTGEWLETTGVEDARFTVLSWLPERRGFTREPEDLPGERDDDAELPLLLPLHRVYDFVHGRQHAPLLRRCALEVEVTSSPRAAENPYHRTTPPPKSFSFSCASASFGAMPLDTGVQQFPPAAMVLVDPLDACTPLKPASLHHTIAVVKRGACFFETKVRNAAKAGAVGVVVVNNEDDDRVMVMSGSGSTETYDHDDTDPKPEDDHRQSVAVPAIMVPRRVGEWLHRHLQNDAAVRGSITLAVEDEEVERAAYYAYGEALESQEEAQKNGDREATTDKEMAPRIAELARRSHPRLESNTGQLGRVTIYAPAWGVELTPVNKPNSYEIGSWLLEIVEAPLPPTREERAASP